MPHKFFDNTNTITLDDLTTSLLSQQQQDLPMAAPLPAPGMPQTPHHIHTNSQNNSVITPDSNNNNNFGSTHQTSDNSLHILENSQQNINQYCEEDEMVMEIDIEKCKYYEKHIHLHDDISNRQCIIQDLNMKVDHERKLKFNDILVEIEKKEPFFKFLREDNILFFVYDPSRKMFVHLPYNSQQDTFILYDFVQDQEYLQIKFREIQKQNSNGQQSNSVQQAERNLAQNNNNSDNCSNYTRNINNYTSINTQQSNQNYASGAPLQNKNETEQQLSDEEIQKQKEQKIKEEFFQSLREVQPMRREKERTIGFAQENVKKWRNYMDNGIDYNGIRIKLNLNQGAQYLGIRRKTLDEYYRQIKEGIQKGFNFQDHSESKIGVLRKFNKIHKNLTYQSESEDENNDNNNNAICDAQKHIQQQQNTQYNNNMACYDQQHNQQQYIPENLNCEQAFPQDDGNQHEFNQDNNYISNEQKSQQEKLDEQLALQAQLEQFSDQEDYIENNNNNNAYRYNSDEMQNMSNEYIDPQLIQDIKRVKEEDNQDFFKDHSRDNSWLQYLDNNDQNNNNNFNSIRNSFQRQDSNISNFDMCGSAQSINNIKSSFKLQNQSSSPQNMSIQSINGNNNNNNNNEQQHHNNSYFFGNYPSSHLL